MKHTYYFLLPLLLISYFTHAQQLEVSGTITSTSDGFPLPGVLVEAKSSKFSTFSDVDGKYKILISDPENETLVFTFMGFLIEEKAVKALNVIDVALSEDIERDAKKEPLADRIKATSEKEKEESSNRE